MLSVRSYQEAEKLARRYDSRDPFCILHQMSDTKLWLSDSYGPDGLKGYAIILNRTRYAVVNAALSSLEQSVVAAHELGHLILHTDVLRSAPLHDPALFAAGKLEQEANLFAADLLISDDALTEALSLCNSDFFACAAHLEVPSSLLSFKLHSFSIRGSSIAIPIPMDNRFLLSGR